MTFPVIHLNGSGADALLENYMNALVAVQEAIVAVRMTAPHGRDYYTKGDGAINDAIREHSNRLLLLESVRHELDALAANVVDQKYEHEDARRRQQGGR